PPPLSSPTLHDLGLSLSVLTSKLSPSHFATPPTNGTFLSPHYLLLCHSQGLDVLPLKRPPAPQPFALVRRVSFKSVVVMEERGVLVAIAGRRDGVRVYALEEVRKAVEWRMEVEVRREQERSRREDAKRGPSGPVDNIFGPVSNAKLKDGPPQPTPFGLTRKKTLPIFTPHPTLSSTQKSSTLPRRKIPSRPPSPPPEYEDTTSPSRPHPHSTASPVSIKPNLPHRASVSTVVGMATSSRRRGSNVVETRPRQPEEKSDALSGAWAGSSDDEAISVVAAGPSGSAALDERTSNTASVSRRQSGIDSLPTTSSTTVTSTPTPNPPAISRPRRPSNLDLSGTRQATSVANPNPSPTPTLTTLRQTLSRSPTLAARGPTILHAEQPSEGEGDVDIEGDEATTPTGERISFAQALLESRLPNIPPLGTRQPQRPVFISASHPIVTGDDDSVPPSGEDSRPTTASSTHDRTGVVPKIPTRLKRRRWTVLDGMFNNNQNGSSGPSELQTAGRSTSPLPDRPSTSPVSPTFSRNLSRAPSTSTSRSQSVRHGHLNEPTPGLPRSPPRETPSAPTSIPSESERSHGLLSPRTSMSSNRFLPRIISNALSTRRLEENGFASRVVEGEVLGRRNGSISTHSQATAPKLEYVKLPGTKGAIMIKAVETARKSFLAILCGDAGEKVELFAGTYRTALGLSRTFILPDSPRNLELQLQGDDLVEVFLVFSHNVFGLEPATVRVREVRIGRAERRAARRRAREARGEIEPTEGEYPVFGDEDANVDVAIDVAISETVESAPPTAGVDTPTSARPHPVRRVTDTGDATSSPAEPSNPSTSLTSPDDLLALAASQIGSYTTFQQLSFAPNFPLAALADECAIPPTYPSVLKQYRQSRSLSEGSESDTSAPQQQVQTPPGLPLPPCLPPSKWYYKDPKGVVRGPWKASLMQSWYKDGFLPLDLPVRRESDTEYILLQDLRLQSVDPNNPFRPTPVPLAGALFIQELAQQDTNTPDISEPLLPPISLLAQPPHYGPPALFFSSRGGHSTAIVDSRGRSVLKGRFFWSLDDEDTLPVTKGRLGDIKRVEAFDVRNRAVIVALRQGGLEAVDVGDALLAPADESRNVLPDYQVPAGAVSRRGTYIWRIGSPVSLAPVASSGEAASTALTLVRKKHSSTVANLGKSSTKADLPSIGFEEGESNPDEEVLFLGRNKDSVYFCERNAASFRILQLAPSF
ncbi:hypothetical protein BU17DRAFT_38538, partial [Hysterangium stoloniferum]